MHFLPACTNLEIGGRAGFDERYRPGLTAVGADAHGFGMREPQTLGSVYYLSVQKDWISRFGAVLIESPLASKSAGHRRLFASRAKECQGPEIEIGQGIKWRRSPDWAEYKRIVTILDRHVLVVSNSS